MKRLAVDDSFVFWNAQYAISRATKKGLEVTTLGTVGAYPSDIVLDAEKVYASDESGTASAAKTGGSFGFVGMSKDSPLAIDDRKIYMSTYDHKGVIAYEKASPTKSLTLVGASITPSSMTVDAKYLYAADSTGKILRIAK